MIFVILLLLAWFLLCIILLIRPGSPSPRRSLRLLSSPGNQGNNQGKWSGVREPRRPRPPYWPPRAASVVPEDTARQESSGLAGSSDSPRQPLRLEDGIA
jgi:hypothetical protein